MRRDIYRLEPALTRDYVDRAVKMAALEQGERAKRWNLGIWALWATFIFLSYWLVMAW